MQPYISTEPTSNVKSNTTSSRKKKVSAKDDEREKITERMEGGIIVRRKDGKKIELW